MKSLYKFIGIIAFTAIIVSVSGCAIFTTTGDTGEIHGIFTYSETASKDATEIASYTVVLGWFDIGYAEYDAKVKEAVNRGRKITSVTRHYFVFSTTTAYERR